MSNWGKVIRAKVNVAEVLKLEVKKKKKGVVGVSTVCDPYMPLEAELGLTRKCLEILSLNEFCVSIQTKSDLVLRDKDLITPQGFDVGVTLTTMDAELARKLEPGASTPEARTKVLEEFSSRGVKTWIFLGPIIPEINDDEKNLKQIIEVARRTKSELIYDKLNLKVGVLDKLSPVLERIQHGLTKRLPDLLSKNSDWWRKTRADVESICEKLEVKCAPAF
jgi:DNA repair photolyase